LRQQLLSPRLPASEKLRKPSWPPRATVTSLRYFPKASTAFAIMGCLPMAIVPPTSASPQALARSAGGQQPLRSGDHLPRFRALALLRRRPSEFVAPPHHRRRRNLHKSLWRARIVARKLRSLARKRITIAHYPIHCTCLPSRISTPGHFEAPSQASRDKRFRIGARVTQLRIPSVRGSDQTLQTRTCPNTDKPQTISAPLSAFNITGSHLPPVAVQRLAIRFRT
jgi:hypothetical protein